MATEPAARVFGRGRPAERRDTGFRHAVLRGGPWEGIAAGQHRPAATPLILRCSARVGHFARLRGYRANTGESLSFGRVDVDGWPPIFTIFFTAPER
jgi:hypothetical protein